MSSQSNASQRAEHRKSKHRRSISSSPDSRGAKKRQRSCSSDDERSRHRKHARPSSRSRHKKHSKSRKMDRSPSSSGDRNKSRSSRKYSDYDGEERFNKNCEYSSELRTSMKQKDYGDSRLNSDKNKYSNRQGRHGVKEEELCQSDSDGTNSEDEIMFDWDSHKWELNAMFFQTQDVIARGSEEYDDFFKFLRKYQAIQKQKKLQQIIDKNSNKKESKKHKSAPAGTSEFHDLPQEFNNQYLVNFAIKSDSVDAIMHRLPPLDLDDVKRSKTKRLSRKKVDEFKNIILLYLNFIQKQNFDKMTKLRKAQSELPIAQYRQKIVDTVAENNIVLIAGDTGCGKSTQVPQYLMHAGYQHVACTQPRRIACISLCKRVAHETLNELGSQVGYQIRFERQKNDNTRILFLTEGLLLRQVNTDATLSNYDVVILDEIHERHLHTDFLLGVVKCLLTQRTHVKIILMSATINLELFSNYFLGKAPIIQVPGRLYPIKLQYFPIPMLEMTTKSDKLNPAPFVRVLNLIDNKYKETERGDVLMFLSGFSEINTVVEAVKLYAQKSRKWVILSLHSNLSISDQEKVFDIPPEGIRKCIVSTNIAETSITIDGVRFVVDSGKVKEMSYDPVCKMQKLKEFWVSQASAEQRKGRAGRTGPGVCFRLYSEEQYGSFDAYSTPEIQRVPLDSLVLQMIAMGMPDVRQFPFIEPPPLESLELSVSTLVAQAAITAGVGQGDHPQSGGDDLPTGGEQLTITGKLLAQLPVDVTIGKMLIMGSLFHQAEASVSLASALSVSSVFTNRAMRDPDCVAAVQELLSSHGDPFTLLSVYNSWLETKTSSGRGCVSSQKWCRLRGLEEQRFYELTKLRHQFQQLLQQSKLHECPTAGSTGRSTAAERAQRYGELQQLRRLRKQAEQAGRRRTKVLRLNHEGEAISDGEAEDGTLDPKHLDFSIKHDSKQLQRMLHDTDVHSFKDVIMLKVVLCSGLYPNIAIADEHNTYKANSEQLFHTPTKPFAILHPTSVFAKQPEVLELCDSDILELPGFSTRHPAATRHQLLLYVSLLETNKAFLMNTFRVPAAQTLLLFAQALDTNADCSVMACDNFIELKFAEADKAQRLLCQSVQLRHLWNQLLELKLQLSDCGEGVDELQVIADASSLERRLSHGLVELYMAEPVYSMRRLLPADVKVLHKGPGMEDAILDPNPFASFKSNSSSTSDSSCDDSCPTNYVKGGVKLTDNVNYNCLLDTECNVTTLTNSEMLCEMCEESLALRPLAWLAHIVTCTGPRDASKQQADEEDQQRSNDPNAKEFYCGVCNRTLWLPIKEIFAHKRSH